MVCQRRLWIRMSSQSATNSECRVAMCIGCFSPHRAYWRVWTVKQDHWRSTFVGHKQREARILFCPILEHCLSTPQVTKTIPILCIVPEFQCPRATSQKQWKEFWQKHFELLMHCADHFSDKKSPLLTSSASARPVSSILKGPTTTTRNSNTQIRSIPPRWQREQSLQSRSSSL
jgi:hypothetical protein